MLSSQKDAILEFVENEGHLSGVDLSNNKKKSVECRCPRCGKEHFLSFLWTGRGTPRKYCHRCREIIAGINTQCIYETSPDIFRTTRGGNGTLE